MINLFLTILISLSFLPLVYLIGYFPIKINAREIDPLTPIYQMAIGLAIVAFFLVGLGAINFLHKEVILFLFVMVFLLKWKKLKPFMDAAGDLKQYVFSKKSWAANLLLWVLMSGVALGAILCLLPETANDSLCYQLNVAKRFVRLASSNPVRYDLNTFMPLLMQHLYALGLMFESVPLAKFFHWITGVGLLGSFILFLNFKIKEKPITIFLACVLLFTPTLFNQIASTYVDGAVGFFLFLSFAFFWHCSKNEDEKEMFYVGLFLGLSISVKMLVGIAALPLAVIVVLESMTSKKPHLKLIVKRFLWIALGGILGCSFWFVRNWIFYGNPVYPYLGALFGTENFSLVQSYQSQGGDKGVLSFLLLFVNITFQREVYDAGFWIGPFYLFFLPLALLGAYRDKLARMSLIFFFVFLTCWYFIAQNVRFLFPVLPIYLIAAGIGTQLFFDKMKSSLIAKSLSFVCVGMLGLMALLGLYHYRYQYLPLSGIWSHDQYVRSLERSYPIAEWMNEHLDDEAVVLNAEEVRQFYFNQILKREQWFVVHTNYHKRNLDVVIPFLKSKGITHVLRAFAIHGGDEAPENLRVLDKALATTQGVEKMVTIASENIREDQYRYELYRL